MTGFVLFFAVACLGGVIATVGDRIGMKVGKSRLSLFNLRPRQTATLVSVVTGMIASFATLTLLFLLDGSLRKGVFQLDDIQDELSEARTELEATQAQKEQAESSLSKSTKLQALAQNRLLETNDSLQTALAREEETLNNLLDTQSQLDEVSEQAGSLRDEIGGLRSEREALIAEQAEVRSQIAVRDREIVQRNAEIAQRNAEITQRNEQLAQRDQALQQRTADLRERDQQITERNAEIAERTAEIAQRNIEIAERETRLEELQNQQAFLSEEIGRLEEEFQGLRLGNVAIARNETIAFTVARPDSEQNAIQAVEQTLAEANRYAVQIVLPRTDTVDNFTLRFDPIAVNDIVSSITDSQSYVIKVNSAANYVVGEPCIADALRKSGPPCLLVNVEAVPNEVIYQPGDVLASIRVSAEDIRNNRLVDRFRSLQLTAALEARRNGIISYRPIIANDLIEPRNDFLTRVDAYGESIEIQAFASRPVYPTGPVYLELAAVQNGDVLFRTRVAAPP